MPYVIKPCKVCGKDCMQPTLRQGTGLCDGCWEVIHRLPAFLTNRKAMGLVYDALAQAELKVGA